MKKFFREFKEFITRGNVMELAIAVIIGGAFGAITTSLVNDILMPLIALAIGVNFTDWKLVIEARNGQDPVIWHYGNFIQAIVNFLIIAFILFLIIKSMNAAESKFTKLKHESTLLTKDEKKELKAKDKSRKEIKAIALEKEAEANRLAELEFANAPAPITAESLLSEIRDLLAKEKAEKCECKPPTEIVVEETK